MPYELIFDELLIKRRNAEDSQIRRRLQKMFAKVKMLGPRAGDLIDVQEGLYEMKQKSPPLRLYFCYDAEAQEIVLLHYEMKTSREKQQRTIDELRERIRGRDPLK